MKTNFAYLAGFIDGDGCLLAQLVKSTDYIYKYQIRITINFYQKTTRHWFLLELQKELGGSLVKRKDGMSVLTIVESTRVEELLTKILSNLRVKRKTAELLLEIINDKKKINNKCDFLKVCKKVDKVAEYTDSKKRKITSEVVESCLKTTCRD